MIITKYFKLVWGTRQCVPISANLFIFGLEAVFSVIKSNQDIYKLRIFEHKFLYTAYADDTTFFLKNQTSVIEIFKVFDKFSKISGLKKINQNAKLLGKGYRWHSAACNASSYMNRLLKFWKNTFLAIKNLKKKTFIIIYLR